MKSPQTENGYIRIATELWDAICSIRIPGEARQVFDFIIRKTYGYQKKEDCISLSQFVSGVKLKKPTICKMINILKKMNLITQKDNDIANIYSINKDYTTWIPLPKKITLPKKPKSITQKANQPLPKKLPTIDNNTQKIVTKDIYCQGVPEYKLSNLLLNLIFERRPQLKKPDIQKWCTELNRMIRLDKRQPDEIEKVIIWTQQDDFWKNNILSPTKLRKQFDQLALKMEQKKALNETSEERNQRMIEEFKERINQ